MKLCSAADCGKVIPDTDEYCTKCKVAKTATVSQKELQEQELVRRVLARRRLLPFVMRMQPDYLPGWVHKDICQRLEQFARDIIDKKSPRLMIAVPPRHGKSLLASTMFPAWFLGNHPEMEVIACSYSASLSMTFSRKIRELLREQSYQNVFKGTRLHKDSQSVENWLTTRNGGFLAAGVGGGITGRGSHLLIVDDPVRNWEDAVSETNRESTWNWWNSTAYTRLAPGGGCLVIQTRWHHDDLSGRLRLQQEDAIKAGIDIPLWEVVEYPAIAIEDEDYRKQGEALHPERYDLKQLNAIKNAPGNESTWSALHQQKPTADEGAYFQRHYFKYYDKNTHPLPSPLTIYASWDLALGQKETNDYTACAVVGIDKSEDWYLLDIMYGRWDAMEIVERMIDVHEQYKPASTLIERTHMQMAIGPFLNKRIRERKQFSMHVQEMLPGRRDKSLRARSLQGRMAQGKVYFPREAHWLDYLTTQLLQFPFGKNDDVVDVLAYLGIHLEELQSPHIATHKKQASWRDQLTRYTMGDKCKSAMSA